MARRYPKQFLDRTIADAVPLSEVLFWMETGGVAAVAAEDRAAVEGRLRKRLERVSDGDVRAHFLRAFRDRLWQRQPARRGKGTKRWVREEPPPPVVAASRDRLRPRPAAIAAERTLLAVLLHQPLAFSHLEEDLGSLAFSTPELERLRQRLVEAFGADPPPDPDALVGLLRGQGLAGAIDELLEDPVLVRHRALAAGAPPEDLEALWQENVAVVRAANERAAEADVDQAFGADEAMARRRLLKLAQLGDDEPGEGG